MPMVFMDAASAGCVRPSACSCTRAARLYSASASASLPCARNAAARWLHASAAASPLRPYLCAAAPAPAPCSATPPPPR
jgi:hypothetical protein